MSILITVELAIIFSEMWIGSGALFPCQKGGVDMKAQRHDNGVRRRSNSVFPEPERCGEIRLSPDTIKGKLTSREKYLEKWTYGMRLPLKVQPLPVWCAVILSGYSWILR